MARVSYVSVALISARAGLLNLSGRCMDGCVPWQSTTASTIQYESIFTVYIYIRRSLTSKGRILLLATPATLTSLDCISIICTVIKQNLIHETQICQSSGRIRVSLGVAPDGQGRGHLLTHRVMHLLTDFEGLGFQSREPLLGAPCLMSVAGEVYSTPSLGQ